MKITAIFRYAFTGFLAGYLVAIILSRWIWLEMRVSLGLLIPVGIVIGAIFGGFLKRINRFWGLWVPETVLVGLLAYLAHGDLGVMAVMPAALLREGILWPQARLWAINAVLLLLAAGGNLLWFLDFEKTGC